MCVEVESVGVHAIVGATKWVGFTVKCSTVQYVPAMAALKSSQVTAPPSCLSKYSFIPFLNPASPRMVRYIRTTYGHSRGRVSVSVRTGGVVQE
jgi:hypothetical protein